MNDHASKLKGLMWLILACSLGVGLVLGLSLLARSLPWTWEKNLGQWLGSGSRQQQCASQPQAEMLLQRLVNRIYPLDQDDAAFSIEVKLVKDRTVNAYAELGGRIYVHSGLLRQAKSPEEIAGVLAHEIGHVYYRHILEGAMSHMLTAAGISMVLGQQGSAVQWANYFLNMEFSRAQEAQADRAGLRRLQKAHVSNQGFRDFFERMEKSTSAPVFLSDHPSNQARLDMAKSFDNKSTSPIMTSEEWNILKTECGAE